MLQKTHRTRFPNLSSSSDIDAWRLAKDEMDRRASDVESEMYEAFGCHGEPIADEIKRALVACESLFREHSSERAKLREIKLEAFDKIGAIMHDVRSELDERLDRFVNDQRNDAYQEAANNLPSGSDFYASDHGVDLNSTLEDAFEAGANAVSGYLDDSYPETVHLTLDDL